MTNVPVGKIACAKSPEVLGAVGVGSCVVIALYDPRRRAGALAHAAFCFEGGAEAGQREGKDASYIEIAIDEMIEKLEASGSKRSDMEAKLAGGANMFTGITSNFSEKNIKAAREKLASRGIRIAGESLGGNRGRSVEFALDTGMMTVRIVL